jgi:hypothetical protein
MEAEQIRSDLAKARRLGGAHYSVLAGRDVTHEIPQWIRGQSILADSLTEDLRVVEELAFPRRRETADSAARILDRAAGEEASISAGTEPARSLGEEIAARVLREQRIEVDAFLLDSGLDAELHELAVIEERLRSRSERDRRHAAFSARVLLEAIADRLFPAREEAWSDRRGVRHDVGCENVANRLSAYVDQWLGAAMETHERRSFQADLDATARWVGSGPHGVHSAADAERAYTRLIGVLAVLARAHRAA